MGDCHSDQISDLKAEIDQLNKKLKYFISIRKKFISEEAQALAEIGKIETKIRALQSTNLMNSDECWDDLEENLRVLAVGKKVKRASLREDVLLCREGFKYDIQTRKKEETKFDRNILK